MPKKDIKKRKVLFASDNYAGIDEIILKAIHQINSDYDFAYGDDEITDKLQNKIRDIFGKSAKCFPVFNGTAANVISLSIITKPFEAIICSTDSHIHNDECGAPERFIGSKLIAIESVDGKISPNLIKAHLKSIGDQHHVQPKVISITQPTECGTIYTPVEIKAIAKFAKQNNLLLHMDGSRLSNAAAALDVELADITSRAGIDILSFGGTKNGLMGADAIITFNAEDEKNTVFARKQGMNLASKMRFISIQLLTMLSNDLWRINASHANSMAAKLANKISKHPKIRLVHENQVNAIFLQIEKTLLEKIMDKYHFYIWDEKESIVRLMTSFATTDTEINEFVDFVLGLK